MGVGKSGATNAGILAVEILALTDEDLAQKLVEYKAKLELTVAEKSKKVSAEIGSKG
jgi:phosphoribosylcarboxyaminoimidazole (NCAIR) mutase